jgi:hypothetical protein
MAYMNKEKKAIIAAAVKPILKKYGMKATLSVENHSSINLNIKSGPIDFGKNNLSFTNNLYWVKDRAEYSEVAINFLEEVVKAMESAGWFDKSDIMTDYFHIAYYININVGRWDRPYVLEV